jgi:hypothetical protein
MLINSKDPNILLIREKSKDCRHVINFKFQFPNFKQFNNAYLYFCVFLIKTRPAWAGLKIVEEGRVKTIKLSINIQISQLLSWNSNMPIKYKLVYSFQIGKAFLNGRKTDKIT